MTARLLPLAALVAALAGCGTREAPSPPTEPKADLPPVTITPAVPLPGNELPVVPPKPEPVPVSAADKAKLEALAKVGASVHEAQDGGFVVRVEPTTDLAAALAQLKGLTCVSELSFASDVLTDDDLQLLAGFDHLASIGFHECERVTGSGFGALAKLPRLKAVSVVGPLTDAACQHLAQIKTLEEVIFNGTKVTDAGLRELVTLPALDRVMLDATPIEGSAFAAPGWVKLREISAAHTAFDDEGLGAVSKLPVLEVLNVEGTKVTGAGVEHLARATKLKELNLGGTAVTGAAFAAFPQPAALRKLNLGGTAFDNPNGPLLGRFTALTNLSLAGCGVTDDGLKSLGELKKLTNLDLSGTKAGDGAAKLAGTLPELEVASFDGTALTDAGLKAAAAGERLKFLYARKTKATKRGALALGREGLKIVVE